MVIFRIHRVVGGPAPLHEDGNPSILLVGLFFILCVAPTVVLELTDAVYFTYATDVCTRQPTLRLAMLHICYLYAMLISMGVILRPMSPENPKDERTDDHTDTNTNGDDARDDNDGKVEVDDNTVDYANNSECDER
eukprot:GEMP01058946.1.p1 GENE.GEMP01058946.1~~GEMP01058946.1.p1  ORF type:complete len:136 (+),score=24.13 GEMP01058946.1:92-499(+)